MLNPPVPGPSRYGRPCRPPRIDLDAICANVAVLCEKAGSAQVMAVVKADGYGHGAAEAATAALAGGAAEAGVATVRGSGVARGRYHRAAAGLVAPAGTDFAPALTAGVQLGVTSLRQLDDVVTWRNHRDDGRRHRQGGHRAEPLRGERADFPALIDALGRAVASGAVGARPDVAPGLRR